MVTIRSVSPIYPLRTFNRVVLPAPVPPEITMFSFARTAAFNCVKNRSRNGAIGEQLIGADWNLAESANREDRSIYRKRRNDDIDAGAVSQTGVAHGRRLIYAPSYLRNDFVDDMAKMSVVFECDIGEFQHTSYARCRPASQY